MPNWCMNNYCFEVDKKHKAKLEWLRNKLKASVDKDEWFDKLAEDLETKIDYTRGNINYVSEMTEGEDEVWFEAEAETAWAPINELWEGVKENFAKEGVELRFYYFAEEPGNEVYETNDKERKHFWGDDWRIESCEDDVESGYWDEKSDVVFALNKQLNTKEFKEEMTQEEINEVLQRMDKNVVVYEVTVTED